MPVARLRPGGQASNAVCLLSLDQRLPQPADDLVAVALIGLLADGVGNVQQQPGQIVVPVQTAYFSGRCTMHAFGLDFPRSCRSQFEGAIQFRCNNVLRRYQVIRTGAQPFNRIRLTVGQKQFVPNGQTLADPSVQIRSVRMTGIQVERTDPRLDLNFLTLDTNAAGTVEENAPERTLGLIAHQQHIGAAGPQPLCFRWWRIRPASHMPLAAMMTWKPRSRLMARLCSTVSVNRTWLERSASSRTSPCLISLAWRSNTALARVAKGESTKMGAFGTRQLFITV